MDKNTIIGFVLIALVLIGFSYYSQPSAEQVAQATAEQNVPTKQQEKAKPSAAAVYDSTALFASATLGEGQLVELKNKKVKVKLNTKGAAIAEVVLNEYNDQSGQPLTLFNAEEESLNFVFSTKNENINTGDYVFTPTNVTDSTVTMALTSATGSSLYFNYVLQPDNYMVNLTITSEGMGGLFAPNTKTVALNWAQKLRQQEKGYDFEQQYSTLTYKYVNESSSEHLSAAEDETVKAENSVDWIAFKNQYFSSVLIAYPDFKEVNLSSAIVHKEDSGYLKDYKADMQAAFDPTGKVPSKFQFYFGPNKYLLLQGMDKYAYDNKELELQELVYLGWPLFRWINRFFTIYVFDWLTNLGLSMGVVLLLITLLLRVIVYPTTKKSYISSVKMRVLKPKMEEINKKYPDQADAMKKQQEIMAMYSRYGASPMGGCLPMLIQMPIWIAMFNFVPNAIELRQQSFLWASDLSTYDDVISWSTHIPLIGNHLSIFCLLFCLSNLVYSYYTMRMQKDTMVGPQADQMKVMQWMMYAMPVVFFFTFNNYSSGLNYYYFVSLLTGAITMWYLRKTVDEDRILAKLEAYYEKNKNNPQKMSGLTARLDALRQKQEELAAKQRKQ